MSDASSNHNKNHYDKESLGFPSLFLSAFKSAVISLAISLLLAAILSGVANASSDPLSMIFPLSLLSLYVSSFLSGFLCMRKVREGALLCGLFSGGIFMLLYMFISLFLPNGLSSNHSFPIVLLLRSLIIIFSFFGACAARSKAKKHRKIKR